MTDEKPASPSHLARTDPASGRISLPREDPPPAEKTAFDHSFVSIDGSHLPLSQFKSRVLLIVNTASFCGFTGQYKGLEDLWTQYGREGLVVIGVPSNDFGWQEPGSAQSIKKLCSEKYGVTFPLTAKVAVRGSNAHPFYLWARSTYGLLHIPRWNFHKYLIGRDGRIAGAFGATTSPKSARLTKLLTTCLRHFPPS